MPRFEIQFDKEPDGTVYLRGRTAVHAVSRAIRDERGVVEVEEPPDERAWMVIRLDGKVIGRIRDHAARMRFRRD